MPACACGRGRKEGGEVVKRMKSWEMFATGRRRGWISDAATNAAAAAAALVAALLTVPLCVWGGGRDVCVVVKMNEEEIQ